MDKKPSRSPYSIDGFVPKQQARHVGFGPNAGSPGNIRGVPNRRPGFRTQPVIRPGQMQPTPPSIAQAVNNSSTQRIINPMSTMSNATTSPLNPERARVDSVNETSRRKRRGKEKTEKAKTSKWKKIVKRSALTLGVIVLCGAGWLGYKVIRDTASTFKHGNLLGFLSSAELKGEAQGRVNILVAGDSADDPGHQGADLTDSIMLLSIDTKNNTAFMLSIPRDLWVNLPDGLGYGKINQANTDTSFSMSGYPSGGMGALSYVVSQDFGVPVDYYALVNYGAFRDLVNAVGGITITINSPDPRGLYDPNTGIKLPNGTVKLDGQQALQLARSRGDGYGSYGFPASDFDRTMYQRIMVLAIKKKAMTTGVLANPVKVGELFDAIGKNVKTNLNTSDARTLYSIMKKINNSSIQSIGLNDVTFEGQSNEDLLQDYTDPSSGEEALIPAAGIGNYSQLQQFLNQLTTNNPIVKEDANVVVLNGGNTTGLAAYYQTQLTNKGMNVSAIGDAPSLVTNTTIIDQSDGKMPATKAALEKAFGKNVTTTNNYGYPGANFIVVLGTNQQPPANFSASADSSSTTTTSPTD